MAQLMQIRCSPKAAAGTILFISVLLGLVLAAGCLTPAEEWNERGVTHHAMGRYEEAVDAFDQAVVLDPNLTVAWRNRGLSMALLGRTDESEASFSRALYLAPEDAETWYYQALARKTTGNRSGALESLERAVSLPPRSRDEGITLHSCLMLQGDILTDTGRPDEANISYRKAHEVMMSTL